MTNRFPFPSIQNRYILISLALVSAGVLLAAIGGISSPLVNTRPLLISVAVRVRHYNYLWTKPSVAWLSRSPEDYGIEPSELDEFTDQLSELNTTSFLVAKDGYIVHEWYSSDYGVNRKHYTSALAKAIAGSMILMAAVEEGVISLDDPASKFIPAWKDTPLKSDITIGQLGSHTSGLDNISFHDDYLQGWRQEYKQNTDLRFPYALSHASVVFEPGTRSAYSGIGYYVLAYAITRSLEETPYPDVRSLLQSKIMEPLGLPEDAWKISYGESYQYDGMRLYAIGSGGSYTTRAVGRIGQLMLNRGQWNGQQIVSPEQVDEVLSYGILERDGVNDQTHPFRAIGWSTNANDFFTSLPGDAYMGVGGGDQILLVVPSLDLVVVRMGKSLVDGSGDTSSTDDLATYFFDPLMDTLE